VKKPIESAIEHDFTPELLNLCLKAIEDRAVVLNNVTIILNGQPFNEPAQYEGTQIGFVQDELEDDEFKVGGTI